VAVPLGGAAFARWTTRYLDTAVERLRALPAEAREHDGLNEDVARLSPLKHANLSVLGRYSFRASTPAGSGATKQRQGGHPLLATLNV
jgi:hypothetical protein